MLKIGDIWCPDVLMCPFCHANLSEDADDAVRNHLMRCAVAINPRQYSERKRGRPKKSEIIRHVEDCVPMVTLGSYRRKCENCGCIGCAGKDNDMICERWEIQPLERCPLCHIRPEKEERYISCPRCRIRIEVPLLTISPDEVLTERWNKLVRR